MRIMILPIYLDPQPVLFKKAEKLSADEIKIGKFSNLINDMKNTMRNANGVGLAAPQVGVSVRIAIIDIKAVSDADEDILELINPTIKKKSLKKTIMEEGCLSIPAVYGNVKRPEKITISYQDSSGKTLTLNADGFLARVIQHEIDHLDGVLFTSKAISLSRDKMMIPEYPYIK